jgi:hypothetical protein
MVIVLIVMSGQPDDLPDRFEAGTINTPGGVWLYGAANP